MKKVLITGANSYVGTNVEKWLMKEPTHFYVETLDMKDPNWKSFDFSRFDVVFHVAGIVHIKETKKNRNLYYKINSDLVFEVANKAKSEEVKQFIFLSSMSVYGIEAGIVNKNTKENPKTHYAKSKLLGENFIQKLKDNNFKIAIIRPPLIYGNGCLGNYIKISSLAKKIPIFPSMNNIRSMIFVDNLSEFIKQIILLEIIGVQHPQNYQYVKVTDMVKLISEINGNTIIFTKIFNYILKVINFGVIKKLFGNFIIDQEMSNFKIKYNTISFKDSIIKSEQ